MNRPLNAPMPVVTKCALALMVILIFGCVPSTPEPPACTGGSGRPPDNCLGFPLASTSPTIDGTIAGDTGWDNAFQLEFENASSVHTASVLGVRDSGNLYLAIDVLVDPSYDQDDVIVLAFDPDGDAANYRRIHIYPLYSSGADPGGLPYKIDYWKGLSSWATQTPPPPTSPPPPAWLTNNVRATSCSAPVFCWHAEIKIPIAASPTADGINLPSTDDFGFYVDVVPVTVVSFISHAYEEPWPRGVKIGQVISGVDTFRIEDTPAVNRWGNAKLASVSNGIGLYSEITVAPLGNGQINLNDSNTFTANVYNALSDSSGTHLTAHGVQTSFSIANWGIPSPGSWASVGTDGPRDMPGVYDNFQAAWSVGSLRAQYAAHPHQCIRANLTSTDSDILIVNGTQQQNMDFVDAHSPFGGDAQIGTKGYQLAKDQPLEFILTRYLYNPGTGKQWKTDVKGLELASEGSYRLTLKADSPSGIDIQTNVTPPDVTIPHEIVKMGPGQPGELTVAVKPGNVITFFVQGSIMLRPEQKDVMSAPVGPDGLVPPPDVAKQFKPGDLPLADKYGALSRIGSVIGSFDGFKETSFPIGAARTILVPANATRLSLAINDTQAGTKLQKGDGFTVDVIQTKPGDIPVSYPLINGAGLEPDVLPLGQNLPTWMLCGQRMMGIKLVIGGNEYDEVENVGCFGYIVKSIGQTK